MKLCSFLKNGLIGLLLLSMFVMSSATSLAAGPDKKDHKKDHKHEKPVAVKLVHTPYGKAYLTWEPTTKNLKVTIKLTGLQALTLHPAHIHAGTSCSDKGAVVYHLNKVKADAGGNAISTTVIPDVIGGIPAKGWYVNVHNDFGKGILEHSAIACGVIKNDNTSLTQEQYATTHLGGTPDPNQNATGYAKLALHDHTLKVHLVVKNLVPGSSHAAHIHVGRCTWQPAGNVVYDLQPLIADQTGVASSYTVIKHVKKIPAGQWYINVHNSTNLSTQAGFDPIACGDINS